MSSFHRSKVSISWASNAVWPSLQAIVNILPVSLVLINFLYLCHFLEKSKLSHKIKSWRASNKCQVSQRAANSITVLLKLLKTSVKISRSSIKCCRACLCKKSFLLLDVNIFYLIHDWFGCLYSNLQVVTNLQKCLSDCSRVHQTSNLYSFTNYTLTYNTVHCKRWVAAVDDTVKPFTSHPADIIITLNLSKKLTFPHALSEEQLVKAFHCRLLHN